MNSKFTPVYTFFVCLSISFLMLSSSSGRSDSRAGAPGDGNCSGCHSSREFGTPTGGVELRNLPSSVEAGMTYDFELAVTQPIVSGEPNRNSNAVSGFQLVAINGTNNRELGTFTAVNGSGTRVVQSNTRLSHSGSKRHFGAATTTWAVRYTTPNEELPEEIVFYMAANAANGNGGNGSGDYGYVNSVSVATNEGVAPLAVDFLNFTTQTTTEGIALRWSVENQNQIEYYLVERSKDGVNFDAVGVIPADATMRAYQYNDETNLTENHTYYYRIQAVDKTGKMTFSTTEVAISETETGFVVVYPNPASADAVVQVRLSSTSVGVARIINLNGQVVRYQPISAPSSTFSIPTTGLSAGVYQLVVQQSDKTYQQKFVIR